MTITTRSIHEVGSLEAELAPEVRLSLINPMLFTNIADVGSFTLRHDVLRGVAPRTLSQKPLNLYRYPRGTIVDADGCWSYATVVEDSLISEQLAPWMETPDEIGQSLKARAAGAPRVDRPCLLAARFGDVTWGHWFCEMLPKIVIAEKFYPKLFTFVVPTRTTTPNTEVESAYFSSVMQSLSAFGIEDHRLLRIPRKQPVIFDSLFDITGIFCDGFHPEVISIMNDRISPLGTWEMPKNPYLIREKKDTRQLRNDSELRPVIEKLGFTPINTARLPLLAQISLFKNADSILGISGSAFFGFLFCRQNLPVVTLAPTWRDGYFVNLFQRKAARWADIRGHSTLDINKDLHHSSFIVPTSTLAAGVEAVRTLAPYRPEISGVILEGVLTPRRLGQELFATRFGKGGDAGAYQLDGWSFPEDRHTWSLGPSCTIWFPRELIGNDPSWCLLEGISFAHDPDSEPKSIELFVNDHSVGQFYAVNGPSAFYWYLDPIVIGGKADINFEFRHPDCRPPSYFGNSNDNRCLGFGFVRIAFFLAKSGPA